MTERWRLLRRTLEQLAAGDHPPDLFGKHNRNALGVSLRFIAADHWARTAPAVPPRPAVISLSNPATFWLITAYCPPGHRRVSEKLS